MTEHSDLDLLCRSIAAGDCVAFVGAGFSAGALGSRRQLLLRMNQTERLPPEIAEAVIALLSSETPSNMDLEAAAQLLDDALEPGGGLAKALAAIDHTATPDSALQQIERRHGWLTGIPFRAILTTNFDQYLAGSIPDGSSYLAALRERARWWEDLYWRDRQPPILKLHGDLGGDGRIVLTRRDYRERLYSDPAYTTFLKALFATTTVLYLGFSFTDAYLNELRSEVLSLTEHRPGDPPIAYAVIPDISEHQAQFMRNHEGIAVFPYQLDDAHLGFDQFLEDLWLRTNPTALLGRAVAGKRILWIDPNTVTGDVHRGMEFLETAAATADATTPITRVATVAEGLQHLRLNTWDLVVTHWGHGLGSTSEESAAEHLLRSMRSDELEAPVIIFAGGDHADDNKDAVTRLGAYGYAYRWPALFEQIDRLFTPGAQSG